MIEKVKEGIYKGPNNILVNGNIRVRVDSIKHGQVELHFECVTLEEQATNILYRSVKLGEGDTMMLEEPITLMAKIHGWHTKKERQVYLTEWDKGVVRAYDSTGEIDLIKDFLNERKIE